MCVRVLCRYPFHRCVSCRAVLSPLRVEGLTHCPFNSHGHVLKACTVKDLLNINVPDGYPLETAKLSSTIRSLPPSVAASHAYSTAATKLKQSSTLAGSSMALHHTEYNVTPALTLLKDLPLREEAVRHRRSDLLTLLRRCVADLQEILRLKAALEDDIWRVDHSTRIRIFQSSQMPVRPSVQEMIAALQECITRQADDEWLVHRELTEVELYHDVFVAQREG